MPRACTWVVVKIRVPLWGSLNNRFWGSLNNRCRIIMGTEKGTIILTTTHMLGNVVVPGQANGAMSVLHHSLRSKA